MNEKKLRTLVTTLLVSASLLFAILGIISTWGDIEATVFNATIKSEKPLSSLRCPAVITPIDDAFVSARIDNPSDRELEMEVRTYVSDGFVVLMKEITTNFYLKPGESEVICVPISVDDAAYDRFVLVRMHQIRRGSLPYLNASCGVVVVNIPILTGTQLVGLIIGLGLLLSAAGLTLWIKYVKPTKGEQLKTFRFLVYFLILSFLNLLTGLSGWWLLAIILAVVWMLLGIGIIGQHFLRDIEES